MKFTHYTNIREKVRKDPNEEKVRLQSRLNRAKTLGQQTRVADALSAARAAAGEKKPSDKREWGASTGTAKRLKTTVVRRTPSGVSKLLAKRLAPLKRVDTSWIDEGASSPKVKFSKTPTIGTFRAGLDPESPNWSTASKTLKPRKSTPDGFKKKAPPSEWMREKRSAASTNAVSGNLKNSDMLLQTMNLKPEGTKFEIYGTKNGKEYVIKVSKVRTMGEVVYMMSGRREVVISSSGAGLQVHDKETHRAILSNGNDMIWESADLSDAGWVVCL